MILLDNRVQEQVVTRRLRVVKYRGSAHGTNEYPFLIDDQGISVLPITSAGLGHSISQEPVPTGVAGLDAMLGIGGYFCGSSVLIFGLGRNPENPTFSASFVECRLRARRKIAVFRVRGIATSDRAQHALCRHRPQRPMVEAGLLRFEAARPSLYGFEMHLARMHRDIEQFSSIRDRGGPDLGLSRPVDRDPCHADPAGRHLQEPRGITAVFTSLSAHADQMDESERSVSSLMDSWISLRDIEADGKAQSGLVPPGSRAG